MEQEINLLHTTGGGKKKPIIQRGLFFNAALGFLGFAVLVSIIVSVVVFMLNSKLTSITGTQNSVIASDVRGGMDEKRVKILTLHDRLASIGKITPTDKTLDDRLKLIVDIIPAGLDVTSLQIEGDKISASISSVNLQDFDVLFNNKIQQVVTGPKTEIKKVVIEGFSYDKASLSYSTIVQFSFNSSL
ncbi:MAG: hypothetical protein ACM3IJ_01805 [Candidatus Levyibacteriota bacterium]